LTGGVAGLSGRGFGAQWRWGLDIENFSNFQVKNAQFYAFFLRTTILVVRNQDQADLIDSIDLPTLEGWKAELT